VIDRMVNPLGEGARTFRVQGAIRKVEALVLQQHGNIVEMVTGLGVLHSN